MTCRNHVMIKGFVAIELRVRLLSHRIVGTMAGKLREKQTLFHGVLYSPIIYWYGPELLMQPT